jgi:hypothetical protein
VNAFVKTCTVCAVAIAGAAAAPSVLAGVDGGLWEVSRSGKAPVRVCVAAAAKLAQFEHRNASCTRDLIRESGDSAEIHYSCQSGDFGRSEITVLTPRSVRVQTQGISANAPFKYVFQARRVGECRGH